MEMKPGKRNAGQRDELATSEWKLLHKTGKDGGVWSLAYAPLGAKRLKRSKQLKLGYSQIFQVRTSCPMLSHSPYMPMLHACRLTPRLIITGSAIVCSSTIKTFACVVPNTLHLRR